MRKQFIILYIYIYFRNLTIQISIQIYTFIISLLINKKTFCDNYYEKI